MALDLQAGPGVQLNLVGDVLTALADPDVQIVTVGAARDLANTDNGKLLVCNGSFALNIPTGLDPQLQCLVLANTGIVTWTKAAGVTAKSLVTDVVLDSKGGTVVALASVVHLGSESYLLSGGPRDYVSLVIPVSDETTNLTTGVAKFSMRMPFAMVVTEVRASVNEAPTGSVLTVDINEAGTTILSTKLTIDATETTSATAAAAAVISDGALADNAIMTFDIDTVGSTTPGKGLKVTLNGYAA